MLGLVCVSPPGLTTVPRTAPVPCSGTCWCAGRVPGRGWAERSSLHFLPLLPDTPVRLNSVLFQRTVGRRVGCLLFTPFCTPFSDTPVPPLSLSSWESEQVIRPFLLTSFSGHLDLGFALLFPVTSEPLSWQLPNAITPNLLWTLPARSSGAQGRWANARTSRPCVHTGLGRTAGGPALGDAVSSVATDPMARQAKGPCLSLSRFTCQERQL